MQVIKRTLLLLLISILILQTRHANAQGYITLKGAMLPVNNLSMTDSLTADGKMGHTASFDIGLASGNSLAMLTQLQEALQNNEALDLAFSKQNFNFKIIEERSYRHALVNEITLPALNASSKNKVLVKVKLQAEEVRVSDGGTIANAMGKRQTVALESNFRIEIDALPTNRIIASSRIIVSSSNPDSQDFTVTVSPVDEALWNDWFRKTTDGNPEKKSGRIIFLAPDMKGIIATLEMPGIDIVSRSIIAVGTDPGKPVFGLRTHVSTIK